MYHCNKDTLSICLETSPIIMQVMIQFQTYPPVVSKYHTGRKNISVVSGMTQGHITVILEEKRNVSFEIYISPSFLVGKASVIAAEVRGCLSGDSTSMSWRGRHRSLALLMWWKSVGRRCQKKQILYRGEAVVYTGIPFMSLAWRMCCTWAGKVL